MKRQQAYQIRLESRTVWVKPKGIITVLSAKDYQHDLQQLAQPLIGTPWAMVMDLTNWKPSPLPVVEVLKQITLWCFANQLTHVALLQPDDPLLTWQYLKATDVEKPADLVRFQVSTELEARQQLVNAGFLQPSTSQGR